MQIPEAVRHDLWSQAFAAVQIVVFAGVSYTARKMYTLDERVKRVENILTGPDGDNGMRSEVGELKKARERQDRLLVRIEERLNIEDRP